MKAAILVLADVESHGDLGRVVNAMIAAQEFKEAGDDVQLVFDGAGTQWPSRRPGVARVRRPCRD